VRQADIHTHRRPATLEAGRTEAVPRPGNRITHDLDLAGFAADRVRDKLAQKRSCGLAEMRATARRSKPAVFGLYAGHPREGPPSPRAPGDRVHAFVLESHGQLKIMLAPAHRAPVGRHQNLAVRESRGTAELYQSFVSRFFRSKERPEIGGRRHPRALFHAAHA
jgi:hypothetical protein